MDTEVIFGRFPILETERLMLRKLTPGDAESLFAILGDVAVTEFYDDDTFDDLSQAQEQIAAWQSMFEHRRGLRWGIEFRKSNQLIGTCGFYGIHRLHKRAGIGYELARAPCGRES